MEKFNSINEVLEFAINAEQESVDFYNSLAQKAKTKDMQEVFTLFAQEEIAHKARLTKIKHEEAYQLEKENIIDLKIADYIIDIKPSADMNYQDALILAMSKEKAAFKLYTTLANKVSNKAIKDVFLSLAQEESKHKLRFEIEYDEFVLREN
ncbi:MAG: ferritin family protein [Bacteroidales bacterium]|nr:ferritin family protein [Bacteroidales bacterium]